MVLQFILLITTEIFKNFLISVFVHIILNISVTAWRFPEILSLGNQFVTLSMTFGELLALSKFNRGGGGTNIKTKFIAF